jgi:hypothetical protein
VIPKEKIPEGQRCVKSKWLFKIKRNVIFTARFVTRGYSQMHGIHFTESYDPVINDVSFRIILIGMMVWSLKANIIHLSCFPSR